MVYGGPPLDLDKEILRLRSYVYNLAELAADMLQHVKIDLEKDDTGFMLLAFTSKQIEHARSLVTLNDVGQYRDAFGLARLMTEGLVQLNWAMQKPEERPSFWRAFVIIGEFRDRLGNPEFRMHEAACRNLLETHCKKFLKKKKRKAFERGEIRQSDIVPNDYPDSWHGFINHNGNFETVGIADMYDAAHLTPLYNYAHTNASGWIHWDPYSIGKVLQFSSTGEIIYRESSEDKNLGAGAYADGFQSLLLTAMWLDQHFKLGHQQRLTELSDGNHARTELK